MKRLELKRFNAIVCFFTFITFTEFFFKLLTKLPFFNTYLIHIVLFNIFISFLLGTIVCLGNKKLNKILFIISLFLIGFIYCLNFCVYKMFGFFFETSLFVTTDQVAGFAGDGFMLILKNIGGIIILLLPFILSLIFSKNYTIKKVKASKTIIRIVCIIVIYLLFLLSLNINSKEFNSAKELYYDRNNIELSIKKLGVVSSFFVDIKRYIIGFEEKIEILDVPEEYDDPIVDEPKEIVYEYNNLDIDFDTLIANEKNNTIKKMHEYFQNETGTKQNEYTGFFKNKNLIVFMAESFNEIAVREDTTPTLYKLVNNGFVFNNFYTPTILSTIGGEFQELTGLVTSGKVLGTWKAGTDYFPFGLSTIFEDAGYNTWAYHDHSYTFQSRYKYLAALGFDNFKGCNNGLEKIINCHQWPESDVEMIEGTFDDYINSDKPFMVYYATVSGHGDYGWSKSAMSKKHRSEVSHLNYSEKPLAYLAANIELNDALELLINKLEEAGKLDDTIIALVGDHHPYYMTIDEVNEISSYQKDDKVEVYRSNFILWNSAMDKVEVDKVGSQIDVIPTLYNLFGLKYDSRLIIGNDVLSTSPGLAIMGDSSWVSDKGTYFAGRNKFVAKEGVEIEEDYVKYMNSVVKNKIAMSQNIIVNDYYRKVLGN